MKKLFSNKLWGILTGVFALLLAVVLVGTYICNNMAFSAINMMFGTSTQERVDDPDSPAVDFYKTSYDFERNGESLYREDAAMIEEAEGAGAVLLWNKQEALPLNGTEKVSCFGHSSVELVECGSGSGYVRTYDYKTDKDVTTTLKDALESRGFSVNETLWNLYATGAASSYKMTSPQANCTPWQQWRINEAPWSVVNSASGSFAAYGDAAIIVLSRSGGEYSDLHYNYSSATDTVGNNDKGTMENTSAEGGYLGLSDQEEELLDNVTRLRGKTFGKVLLLLNTGNPLQMQDLEKYYGGIDACMWIGQPGSTGINAVADLLKGEDMNGDPLVPSGRLTDTWVYDNNSAPATVNDGNYTYGNANLLTGGNLGTTSYVNKYMVYQEGIYVGYRYYETRYADCVTGDGNADSEKGAKHSQGGWSYAGEVAFPFGYGLSYTTFEYSDFSVEKEGDEYIVNVKVTNKGDTYTAREVVQIYLQKPYSRDGYDKEHQIEKSAVELVGYAKTQPLKPGGDETVTIRVPEEYFKTYDANGEGTYILEKGDYYLTVASDAHAAVNNILSSLPGNYEPEEQSVLGGGKNTADVKGAVAEKITVSANDFTTYSVSAQTGNPIYNQLDSGDINKYENRGSNSVVWLSRDDWDKTYPESAAQLSLNSPMVNDLRFDNVPDGSAYEMPDYQIVAGTEQDDNGVYLADIEKGDVVAYQFMDAPLYPEREKDNPEIIDGKPYSEYWEDMWEQLLDEMSFEEQANMVVNAFHWVHGANSIALPESRQENGPVGITKREEVFFSLPNDDTIKGENGTGWTWVAYPCAGILASSFDNDIAERVGQHKSEDMLYLGYNGIYGPGVNIHRSPFGGRAFEYPSEDPFLAGMIEAYEVRGIESKGCMAYAKHFALNDMETNRVNCGIWSNEQASREIYLRAFEIVFTEGGASATMNAYTRIGTRWNGGCYAMMTSILRDEWGYDGLVISDWVTAGSAMSYVDGVLAGTDTFDGNGTASELIKYKDNAAIAQAVRTSAKRIIYNIVRTNAMNGTSVKTKYVSVTPWWQTALYAIDWTVGVLFVGCAGMLAASIVLWSRGRKKAAEEPSDGPNE